MNRILHCRACQSSALRPILDLGSTPLANALRRPELISESIPTFPLRLVFCEACSLVQIDESVPPESMFSDYVYFSSFSETMVSHAHALATELLHARGLDASKLVIEIASNDGYLLQHYKAKGIPVLGIEPAANIAEVARRERGIPTRCEFFSRELALTLSREGVRADVLHAHNVLAHVPDLTGFVAGIATLLTPDGVAVIEAPHLLEMVDGVEFDTIYHEHLCYFSLTALTRLFTAQGLTIVRCDRIPIHGGSLRIHAQRSATGVTPDESVRALLELEARWGVADVETYLRFAAQVDELRASLNALLAQLKAKGASVAAYGASAKGSTMLSYCGVDEKTLDFVVDRSTYKQGLFMPGVDLEILPPSALLDRRPDYALLLTWNFSEEILQQQRAYIDGGGHFIIPVPEPHIA